jgi:hypothetical protein
LHPSPGTHATGTTSYQQECATLGSDDEGAAMKVKGWAAPVALAVLVVALLGGVTWLVTRGDDGTSAHRPGVLHLSAAGGGQDAAFAATADEPTGGAPYRLVGDLPTGQPDDQQVYRMRTATADDATTVADALGLTGTPKQVSGGWVLRDGDNRLVVRDDGGWSYGIDCAPDTPVSDEDVYSGCAVASSGVATAEPPRAGGIKAADDTSGGSSEPCNPETDDCVSDPPMPKPVPEPTFAPGPSEAEARAAAAPILDRLGLADATVTVWTGDPSASVQVTPKLDGRTVVGWTTNLQIDGDGRLVGGDGWLTDPVAVDRYPVITAQRAFDLLAEQPRPMMELCAQRPDGKPGCADAPPVDVTGATLGLVLAYDGQRALLVPAWLFEVKDQPEPLTQIAIDPSYLASPTPEQPPEPVPIEPGAGGSEPADPGSPVPDRATGG